MTNDEAIAVLQGIRYGLLKTCHVDENEAITHAIACLRERQWQTIETAPYGKRILLAKNGFSFIGMKDGWPHCKLEPFGILDCPDAWQPLPQPPREGGV